MGLFFCITALTNCIAIVLHRWTINTLIIPFIIFIILQISYRVLPEDTRWRIGNTIFGAPQPKWAMWTIRSLILLWIASSIYVLL